MSALQLVGARHGVLQRGDLSPVATHPFCPQPQAPCPEDSSAVAPGRIYACRLHEPGWVVAASCWCGVNRVMKCQLNITPTLLPAACRFAQRPPDGVSSVSYSSLYRAGCTSPRCNAGAVISGAAKHWCGLARLRLRAGKQWEWVDRRWGEPGSHIGPDLHSRSSLHRNRHMK